MDLSELPSEAFLRHPWEVARSKFFCAELTRAGLLRGRRRVLDVGSGDAWFAHGLAQAGSELEVVCWDTGYESRQPEQADRVTYTAKRPEGEFQVLLLLDVAEHVPDDRAFMDDVLTCAAPGAYVLFSVPAWPSLYCNHDEALRHYRRYTPQAARALLRDARLEMVRSGGLFHSLLLPRYVQAKREGRAPGVTLTDASPPPPADLAWKGSELVRRAVLGMLLTDGLISRGFASLGVDLPGLSWWALCRKS